MLQTEIERDNRLSNRAATDFTSFHINAIRSFCLGLNQHMFKGHLFLFLMKQYSLKHIDWEIINRHKNGQALMGIESSPLNN